MLHDQFLDTLGNDVAPLRRGAVSARLAIAVVVGLTVALGLLLALLGVQTGLARIEGWGPLLLKASYAGSLATIAGIVAWRLGIPGRRAPSGWWLAVPLAVLGVLAIGQLALASPAEAPVLVMGSSWRRCPLVIAALSLPILAAGLWFAHAQAPTRPRRTGAAIGLAAGGAGAAIYALTCTENAAAFVFVWYSLGIALTALIGAGLGARLLRW